MTQEAPKNVSASVRDRLLNLSRERGEDHQLMLIRFATERLLYRLSRSSHAKDFILKGAMLFAVWSESPYRPTRDVDFLASGEPDQDTLKSVIASVINQPVEDDGLQFDEASIRIEEIREMDLYEGLRIRMKSYLGKIEILVQMDLGFGDVVTPDPVPIEYPTLLDFPVPKLRAYPPESVVAEKVEAIVKLAMANSRMKDFYDLFVIIKRFPMDITILAEAMKATFKRRGTAIPKKIPVGLTDEFSRNTEKQKLWNAFLNKNTLKDAPEDLSFVVDFLRNKLMPILKTINDRSP